MNKKDLFYMSVAELTATQSKDPNTKVGSVLVKDGKILSVGWNGPPRSLNDSIVPFTCRDRSKPLKEQKYPYILHSEVNSLLNYAGQLDDLKDSSLYVTVFPCHNCALQIIQAGIKEIYYLEEYKGNPESDEMSKYLFDMTGIRYIKLDRQGDNYEDRN